MARNYAPKHKKPGMTRMQRIYATAAILLLLAVGSAIMAMAPLAKYVNTTSQSDSARVAAFAVSATQTSTTTEYALDASTTTADYTFTVANTASGKQNEVLTGYDVKLTLPSAMTGVTPTLKNGAEAVSGTASADGKTYTFSNAGTLPAGTAQTDTLTLTFTLDTATAQSGTWENIALDVTATQID